MPRVSPCISTRKFLTSNLYEIIIAKFKHALHKCNFSCPKSIIKWLKTIFKLFKTLNSLIKRHGSVSQLPPPPPNFKSNYSLLYMLKKLKSKDSLYRYDSPVSFQKQIYQHFFVFSSRTAPQIKCITFTFYRLSQPS